MYIPCQRCGQELPKDWNNWFVCDTCGYRICHPCLGKEKGFKCDQCTHGYFKHY